MNDSTDIWDSYWRGPRVACCASPGEANYPDSVKSVWYSFFECLQHADRVLDLCTGNGAVLLFALDYATENALSLDLHGVDLAGIDPARHNSGLARELGQIEFHAKTSVSDMPFESEAFNVATSQYGIEYTPLDLSVPEVCRVLKNGGRGQFVLHATEGVTARQSAEELGDIHELLSEIDVFGFAREAFRLVKNAESSPARLSSPGIAEAKRAVERFERSLRTVADVGKKSRASVVFQTVGIVLEDAYRKRQYFPLDALLNRISEAETTVLFHRGRLEALVAASKNRDDCGKIAELFLKHGCSRATTEAVTDGAGRRLIGWRVEIRK